MSLLLDVPQPVLIEILLFLDLIELRMIVSRVCKEMYKLSRDPNVVKQCWQYCGGPVGYMKPETFQDVKSIAFMMNILELRRYTVSVLEGTRIKLGIHHRDLPDSDNATIVKLVRQYKTLRDRFGGLKVLIQKAKLSRCGRILKFLIRIQNNKSSPVSIFTLPLRLDLYHGYLRERAIIQFYTKVWEKGFSDQHDDHNTEQWTCDDFQNNENIVPFMEFFYEWLDFSQWPFILQEQSDIQGFSVIKQSDRVTMFTAPYNDERWPLWNRYLPPRSTQLLCYSDTLVQILNPWDSCIPQYGRCCHVLDRFVSNFFFAKIINSGTIDNGFLPTECLQHLSQTILSQLQPIKIPTPRCLTHLTPPHLDLLIQGLNANYEEKCCSVNSWNKYLQKKWETACKDTLLQPGDFNRKVYISEPGLCRLFQMKSLTQRKSFDDSYIKVVQGIVLSEEIDTDYIDSTFWHIIDWGNSTCQENDVSFIEELLGYRKRTTQH